MMTWDDLTIHMKDPESLPELDPVNDFFWNRDQYKTEVLHDNSIHLQKILYARYELVTSMRSYGHASACSSSFQI